MKWPCNSCRGVFSPYSYTPAFVLKSAGILSQRREPVGIRFAPGALTAGAAKLGISRVPQHPATLAACRLRSQIKQHAEGVSDDT